MTYLYVARHGETEWNRKGRLQGWDDSQLTDKGKAQAGALGERLKEISIDKVYISPLGRVKQTAEIALKGLSVSVSEDERLREISLGEWEGLRSGDAEERHPELYRKALEEPHLFDPPWGEDYYELKRRVVEAVEEIVSKHEGKNVLLISHGLASKTLISHFEGRSMRDLRKGPNIGECSLSLIDLKDGCFENPEKSDILLYGDTSHLDCIDHGEA